jgi:outer membrane receptor for ferrienterochelin and colicin
MSFRAIALSLCVCVFAAGAAAQSTAVLQGVVQDPSGAVIPEARIRVENPVTRFRAEMLTSKEGVFEIRNIPFHTYTVTIEREGFEPHEETVSLRSNVPHEMLVRLAPAGVRESITVAAVSQLLVDPEETGTHVQMNQSDIEKLALQAGNKGLESIIVSMPGFAQNANGAIHPRGAHNQMTFVIDGMPVSDQLTGAFANAVDPNIVQTVELFTGNVPAEYGNKVSAVANITTKSGMGTARRFGGSTLLNAAQFDLLSQVTQVSGEAGHFGYSAVINTSKTNRYLDSVSLDNLHNGGNNQRAFTRFDWHPGARDVFRLNLMAGRASFQLANLRSQHANGMDQRQLLRDGAVSLGWVRTLNAQTTMDANFSARKAQSWLRPSAGDIPVTASQARQMSTITAGARLNAVRRRHTLRAGFDIQRYPVSEHFTMGITVPDFNDPLSPEFNPNLLPHDLSRGGRLFDFRARRTGGLYSGFLQDAVSAGRLNLSLGLRFDAYRFLVNGNQWQPRLGAAYHIRETGTVLRASYSRLYQTPPNENLLLSSSPEAARITPPLVQEKLGGWIPMRPEEQNFLEAGLQQAIGKKASLNVSWYHKNSRNLQDNNNFLDTGIIFPITLSRIRVNGVEGRLVGPVTRGFSYTVSVTHSRAIATPPFTGGLFLGNDAVESFSQGAFVIDHDQPLSVHAVLNWNHRSGWYATASSRYDYGLVANPSDPAEVAADPDFRDLLPYVKLEQTPARVRPRNIVDLVVGFEKTRDQKKRYDIGLQFTNLTDRTALYNFQSIFVGTRVVQPFTAGVRLRYYF